MRIVFAGTPEFAAKHLQALINSKHELVAVYTQPDRPAGRGKKLSPSAVKSLALAESIPVYQPNSLKGEAEQQQLAALNADIMVVVAYGLLLPQAVLDIPPLGCINVHGSLLPKWRGAAPVQRAIEAGDSETGITIMQMDAGLDTGDMLLKTQCPISEHTTSTDLFNALAEQGPKALLTALEAIAQNSLTPEKQDNELASYASKILKHEAEIDWRQSASVLQRRIRAFDPFPGCYGELGNVRIKIWRADCIDDGIKHQPGTIVEVARDNIIVACGEGSLRITQVQLPNKSRVSVSDLLNANQSLFAEYQCFSLPSDV